MKYAYNNNGVLRDVVMTHPSIIFPASYAQQFIKVPDEAQSGWLWDWVNATEPVQTKTVEQLMQEIVEATQKRLDDFAKTRNYDGILSACTYATSAVPKFQTEGQYCVNARDNTWAALYQLFDEVTNGITPMPTSFTDVESLLPELEWPDETSPA